MSLFTRWLPCCVVGLPLLLDEREVEDKSAGRLALGTESARGLEFHEVSVYLALIADVLDKERGQLYDMTGSYMSAFMIGVGFNLFNLALIAMLTLRTGRNIRAPVTA